MIQIRLFQSLLYAFLFTAMLAFTACGGSAGNDGNTPANSSSKTLLTFSIVNPSAAGIVDETAKTVSVTVPYGTNVTNLAANFTTTGDSTSVGTVNQTSGTTANNFTSPVVYRITAVDGSFTDYTVTVTVALNSAKAITSYSILSIAAVIDETAKTISLTLPYGTSKTALVADFSTTGASVKVGNTVQTSTSTSNDFTSPVKYTVTAADGSSADYTVTVNVALNSAKAITSYSINSVTGTINETAKTIAVTLPFGTDITALVATFVTTGSSVKVGSTEQISVSSSNDFTNPAKYRVTAADSTFVEYTVTVTVTPGSMSNDITLPVLKSSAVVSITDGTSTNKYGFAKLWSISGETKSISISTKMRIDNTNRYYYFGDSKLVLFFYYDKWYCIEYPYTYDTATNTGTLVGVYKFKLFSSGSGMKFFKDNLNIITMLSSASFSQNVMTIAESDMAPDPYTGTDNPTINSISASYKSSDQSVDINYNISAPSGTTISSISFILTSPTLFNTFKDSTYYIVDNETAIRGQSLWVNSSVSNLQNASGTKNVKLIAPENGEWAINSVWVNTSAGTKYLFSNVDGTLKNTYHYQDSSTRSYKDLGASIVKFTVSAGGTPDLTAPVLTDLNWNSSTRTLTLTTTKDLFYSQIRCVEKGKFNGQSSGSVLRGYMNGTVMGSNFKVWTFNIPANGSNIPSGNFYIAQIILTDNSGNSSVYFGYDTDVSYWSGDFSSYGFDFSKFMRFKGTEAPLITTWSNITFTK